MHITYILITYLKVISLPLAYLNFPHLSFLMRVWVFIQQFRHMWAAGYSKFHKVGGKLAISTIFLVDLNPHFFQNMFSCSWSSEQHLALCL